MPAMAEPYVGEIAQFAFNAIPTGWLECKGQLLTINQYTALYSLLGTQFGGDGRANFRLPDLRSRAVLGIGKTATNYTYTTGTYGGVETVALSAGNLPAHSHTVVADKTNAGSALPGQNYFAKAVKSATDTTPEPLYASPPANMATSVPLNPASVTPVGAGAAHANIQPYLAISYCIATSGIYPMRP
jgi:microcystin-dependent protein